MNLRRRVKKFEDKLKGMRASKDESFKNFLLRILNSDDDENLTPDQLEFKK